MQYNPKTKGLTIAVNDADRAASYLLGAIHYFRKSHGLPLNGLSREDFEKRQVLTMPGADTCEYCILMAAESLGIDLGTTRAGVLDVREHS